MSLMLTDAQRSAVRSALLGRPLALCFGAGVDSTAMLVLLRLAGLRPSVITFADTGGEKPPTWAHLARIQALLREWGWPTVDVCRKATLSTTPYDDLEGNCLANETLPSLAFGLKSCSIKWKQQPQDQFLMGVSRGPARRSAHPLWRHAQARGQRIVKLIGYDCGKADRRRAAAAGRALGPCEYCYPLQLAGWSRADCVRAIEDHLGADMVPIKSACFFCPASRPWELFWLAGHHPELMDRALHVERRALTGRHSRFDDVDFGGDWEAMVRDAPSFPSTKTTVGLGRSFAWNHWARLNGVVDENFTVRRTRRARFIAIAAEQLQVDNALDRRACGALP